MSRNRIKGYALAPATITLAVARPPSLPLSLSLFLSLSPSRTALLMFSRPVLRSFSFQLILDEHRKRCSSTHTVSLRSRRFANSQLPYAPTYAQSTPPTPASKRARGIMGGHLQIKFPSRLSVRALATARARVARSDNRARSIRRAREKEEKERSVASTPCPSLSVPLFLSLFASEKTNWRAL